MGLKPGGPAFTTESVLIGGVGWEIGTREARRVMFDQPDGLLNDGVAFPQGRVVPISQHDFLFIYECMHAKHITTLARLRGMYKYKYLSFSRDIILK